MQNSAFLQVSNAAKSGAAAVLIANNGTDGFFRMQPDTTTGSIGIPSGSLPLSTARPLWSALAAGMALKTKFLAYALPSGVLHVSPYHFNNTLQSRRTVDVDAHLI